MPGFPSRRVNLGAPGASNGRVGGSGRSGSFCAGGAGFDFSSLNAGLKRMKQEAKPRNIEAKIGFMGGSSAVVS